MSTILFQERLLDGKDRFVNGYFNGEFPGVEFPGLKVGTETNVEDLTQIDNNNQVSSGTVIVHNKFMK